MKQCRSTEEWTRVKPIDLVEIKLYRLLNFVNAVETAVRGKKKALKRIEIA
jgi:hypothetical protein